MKHFPFLVKQRHLLEDFEVLNQFASFFSAIGDWLFILQAAAKSFQFPKNDEMLALQEIDGMMQCKSIYALLEWPTGN